MKIWRKPSKTKLCATAAFTFGFGWILKEIKKTYDSLSSVLDTSVIHFLEPAKYPEWKIALDYCRWSGNPHG